MFAMTVFGEAGVRVGGGTCPIFSRLWATTAQLSNRLYQTVSDGRATSYLSAVSHERLHREYITG